MDPQSYQIGTSIFYILKIGNSEFGEDYRGHLEGAETRRNKVNNKNPHAGCRGHEGKKQLLGNVLYLLPRDHRHREMASDRQKFQFLCCDIWCHAQGGC